MTQKLINRILIIIVIVLVAFIAYRLTNISDNLQQNAQAITLIEPVEVSEETERNNKEKIQNIVKEYIINNPEIIVESVEQLQKRKIAEMENNVKNYIQKEKNQIEDKGNFPVIGNKNGDITIVSLYDYNCSYCKKGDEQISKLLESDSNVSVILRPFPILGDNSLYVAKVILAIHKLAPDKFLKVHYELMSQKNLSQENVNKIIVENGFDIVQIQEEMTNSKIQDMLNQNFNIANNLRIQGVPAYIINARLIPGIVDFAQLKSIIADIRAGDKN